MTNLRSQIHYHHIIPVSLGGTNNKGNLISVCPTCHSHVFQSNDVHGIHSKKNNNSIIMIQILYSTVGHVLEYKNIDSDELKYCEVK